MNNTISTTVIHPFLRNPYKSASLPNQPSNPMSSSVCNPYPQLDLTYDRKTDTIRCIEMRDKSNVAVRDAEANLRRCIENLTVASAAGNYNTQALDQAVEAYLNAKRDLDAALSRSETTVACLQQIEAAMSTDSYAQAHVCINDDNARVEKEERDALERAEAAVKILSTLDPQVIATVGKETYYAEYIEESDRFVPGQLVACSYNAVSKRTFTQMPHRLVLVIREEDGDRYCIACDDLSDLRVVHRTDLRAV